MRVLSLLLLLAACGNAEIVAPEPLWVFDTAPSNGAVVPDGERPIAVSFSEDVVPALLEDSVLLEETTPQGTPIRALALTLDTYQQDAFTAVFTTEPLSAGSTYALTVKRDPLRATNGAKLLSDLTRRFQTQ